MPIAHRYPRTVTSGAPRLRFAPSPTGYLHVGNARAALFNWLEARRTGGEMLLRVEDTDRERSSSELVENILASLRWLGLEWDGEIVFQADNLEAHREAALSLLGTGRAYWCDCTSEQIQARAKERGGPPGYDGHCRDRGLDQSPTTALRFRVPDDGTTSFTDLVRGEVTFDNKTIEDFVLLRSSGMPMFLLSNAFDDAEMGITHVVRGEDHVPGTPKYLLLRDALGLGRPDVFAHLPMLVNEGRKKLSKRKEAVSVAEFAEEGYLPEAMVNYLALLGWGPPDGVEIRPLEEIVEQFRLEDVTPSPAFFDVQKLQHINAEYLRALPTDEFVRRARPFLTRGEAAEAALAPLAELVQERVRLLTRGRADDRVPARRGARARRRLVAEGDGQGQGGGRDARGGHRRAGRHQRLVGSEHPRRGRGGGGDGGTGERRGQAAAEQGAGSRARRDDRAIGRTAVVRIARGAGSRAHPHPAASRRR